MSIEGTGCLEKNLTKFDRGTEEKFLARSEATYQTGYPELPHEFLRLCPYYDMKFDSNNLETTT